MTPAQRTIRLYPWFKAAQSLLFWQATWFLYFQSELSAAEAILLYAVYDLATTAVEVPSGYLSDRIGRRITLILSAIAATAGMAILSAGDTFPVFALGQVLIGTSAALWSGTDSALLYESLAAEGRAGDVEAEELRAWRASFTAFAISAVTGGAMALWWDRLPFLASTMTAAATIWLAFRFAEPPHGARTGGEWARLGELRSAFTNPVLVWLFALAVLMYGFSHIPFVFGQPFIQQALAGLGLEAETPLVSGAVTAVMMLVSVATSWLAPGLRRRIGLGPILLLAFGIQVMLAAVLAATNAAIVILILFLRMVPSSLSRPFILARIQPALGDATRATYLSVQSLVGRVVFAVSLWVAAGGASETGDMAFAEIRWILACYAGVGVVALVTLAATSRRLPMEQRADPGPDRSRRTP